jgi:hypothetical protein
MIIGTWSVGCVIWSDEFILCAGDDLTQDKVGTLITNLSRDVKVAIHFDNVIDQTYYFLKR